MSLLRRLFKDPLYVLKKTHVQHFVGFIEDQSFEVSQVEGATPNMVHDSAGGANNNVLTISKLPKLGAVVLAAIDREGSNA